MEPFWLHGGGRSQSLLLLRLWVPLLSTSTLNLTLTPRPQDAAGAHGKAWQSMATVFRALDRRSAVRQLLVVVACRSLRMKRRAWEARVCNGIGI